MSMCVIDVPTEEKQENLTLLTTKQILSFLTSMLMWSTKTEADNVSV